MSYTRRFTETVALLENLSPVSVANGAEVFTAYVDLENYHRAVIIMHVGVMGQGGTINAQVHQATSAAGANAKHITGKAITQLTQASGDDGADIAIEVRTEETDVDGGFHFIALGYTVGTAASLMSIEIYGFESRYEDVTVTPWAEVVD